MTDTPPPPGLPQAPLADASTLKVGDVVQVAVQLLDKTNGQPFWWKRFCVVTRIGHRSKYIGALTLKMHPDLEKDLRTLEFATDGSGHPQVITKLREPWPQGVAAMWMKLSAQKIITIGDE